MTLYEITNIVTGMGYVGITKDRVKKRWWMHKKCLRIGKHHNKWLQNSYNKYGVDNFEYRIRQVCNSIEELCKLEKTIIRNEKGRLYNMRDGGYDAPPVKHTEESKRKISEIQKIPVVGMSIKTGEIKEYPSSVDTKIDGFNSKNIGKCCKLHISHGGGRIQQAISTGKWVWMYKTEFNLEEMGRRRKLALQRGNNDQSRGILGKSLIDGSTVSFRSCSEAARILGVLNMTLRRACNGDEVRSTAQRVWVFADELEPTILLEKRYLYALKTFNGHRVIGPRSIRVLVKKV